MRAPPAPRNDAAPPVRAASARIRLAPSASPEDSPATRNTSSLRRRRAHGALPAATKVAPTKNNPAASAARIIACKVGGDRAGGLDRDAGEPRGGGRLHRSRPDRRQVEAAVLPGLRPFHENAGSGGDTHASLAPQRRDAREHLIGALGGFDREHVVVRDHHGLPDIERPDRGDQRKPARDVGVVARGRGDGSQRAGGNEDFGRDLMGADETQALLLDDPCYARQEVIVPAPERSDDARQQP